MKKSMKAVVGVTLVAGLFMGGCGESEASREEALRLVEAQGGLDHAAPPTQPEEPVGEQTEEPDPTLNIDACTLIKDEEITEIWGVKVESEEKDRGCEWREPGATASDWGSFRLVLSLQGGGVSGLRASIKAMEDFASEGYKIRKMDVGDEGYEDGSIAMFTVDDVYVALSAMFNKEIDFTTPRPVELARKVASRI